MSLAISGPWTSVPRNVAHFCGRAWSTGYESETLIVTDEPYASPVG